MIVHENCRYFRGDLPCKPHKEHSVHCENCEFYDETKERILIIKLGAIGDVIRTTPLIEKIKKTYPMAEITWITHSPDVVPSTVDKIYKFNDRSVTTLLSDKFDILYSLDKDAEGAGLANLIEADVKEGFVLKKGKCVPANEKAIHKWMTGLFDDLNKENTKSYPQEIFEICGFEFKGEEYVLPPVPSYDGEILEGKSLIGLNTGCGDRWTTRLWQDKNWKELIKKLIDDGYGVLLLGGPDEDEKNKKLSKETGAQYFGTFSIREFCGLMDRCEVIVTAVTMAMHYAIGLKKKMVLFNNIFNKHEFELYGRGVIVEPDVSCKGCFKQRFDEKCEVKDCMELVTKDQVVEAIKELL